MRMQIGLSSRSKIARTLLHGTQIQVGGRSPYGPFRDNCNCKQSTSRMTSVTVSQSVTVLCCALLCAATRYQGRKLWEGRV